MGRMLEALKNADAGRIGLKEKPFLDDAFENGPLPEPPAPTVEDSEIPYIEVGPNRKIEGSAQVLAVKVPSSLGAPSERRAPAAFQPPHQPKQKLTQIQPVLSEASPAHTLGVAFEPWPTLPPLGQGIAPEIITFHHPEHPISKQYAGLIAKMQEGPSQSQPRVVLLTGGRANVGASTVLLNLAVAAAQLGKGRVVVVDANLRRPCLAQRLGYTSTAGLQDVLEGKLALEQAVVQTTIAGLHLISAQVAGPAPRLRVEAVRWLFSWLAEHFNLALIDAPSLDAPGELNVLAQAADGVYLVLPENEDRQAERTLAHSLTAMGARLQGLFHTHCDGERGA